MTRKIIVTDLCFFFHFLSTYNEILKYKNIQCLCVRQEITWVKKEKKNIKKYRFSRSSILRSSYSNSREFTMKCLYAFEDSSVSILGHLPFAPLISVVPPIKDFNPKFGDDVLSLIFFLSLSFYRLILTHFDVLQN